MSQERVSAIRDRSYENQRHRASGLNLLVAAIILWNTTYPQSAIYHLRDQGQHPAQDDLTHLSPLGWEHLILPATTTGKHRLRSVQIIFGRSAPGYTTSSLSVL